MKGDGEHKEEGGRWPAKRSKSPVAVTFLTQAGRGLHNLRGHEELHNLRGHGLEGGMGSSWVERSHVHIGRLGPRGGESEQEFVMV